jgi:hypothetical protein
MTRLSYFAVLLAITAASVRAQDSNPSTKQSSNPKSAPDGARVEHVIVRGTDDAMEVEIQTSGAAVAPDSQAIVGPDRIVVDFPGALPATELRALKVNRGALKGVRSGLFFSNPPITRIVLDLTEPQAYQISTIQNAVVVKLSVKVGSEKTKLVPAVAGVAVSDRSRAPGAKFRSASLTAGTLRQAASSAMQNAAGIQAAVEGTAPVPVEVTPSKPTVTVTFENGLLRILADKATLAQILFEVQRQTRAEIAIPAGAEQEEVVADLGPAPARDVLASLLNGSSYNFIFVGSELTLEKVILSHRDSSLY